MRRRAVAAEFPSWSTGFRATTRTRLFRKLDPAGLQTALLRLAQDWGGRAGRRGGGGRQGAAAVVRQGVEAVADAPAAYRSRRSRS